MRLRTIADLLLLLFCSQNGGAMAQSDNNVALGKPVHANTQWAHYLVDGKLDTTAWATDSTFPVVVIDLQDVYELDSINIHAPSQWTFGETGLSMPFSVYVWSNFTSTCDIERFYPWTMVGRKLWFTQEGDEIMIDATVQAQYIIILPDFEDPFMFRPGLKMGEIMAYGHKIRNGYKPEKPADGEPVINIREARNVILKDLASISVNFGPAQFSLQSARTDVAIAWYQTRIGIIAALRDAGRLIFMTSFDSIERLSHDCATSQLFKNFRKWLNQRDPNSPCVKPNEGYKTGNVLLITSHTSFHVKQVYRKITGGENSAIIVFPTVALNDRSSMGQLVRMLNLRVVEISDQVIMVDLDTHSFINHVTDIPVDNELQVALNSWSEFQSKRLPVFPPTENELQSEQFQSTLVQVLRKYLNFFTYYAPCSGKRYVKNDETHTALLNYNHLLLMQRGRNIIEAPGSGWSPGMVHPSLTASSYSLKLIVDVAGDFFPTAGYAKPGVAVRYTVLDHSCSNISDFHIRINPQTDDLQHKDTIWRWPVVTQLQTLQPIGEIVSPFGGPIVISAPANSKLNIRLENVYRYPWFNIRDPNARRNWDSERKTHRGTPYLMIMGDNMISMIDTGIITLLNAMSIEWATRHLDNIVKVMHNYRGTRFEESRMEVFVTDDDLTHDISHAGYPFALIRTLVQKYAAGLKSGDYGLAREIGHNLQVPGMTFKEGTEVTNLVYIPIIHKFLLGIDTFTSGSPGSTKEDESSLVQTWKSRQYQGVRVSYYNYLGRLFGPALVGNVLSQVVHTNESLNTEDQKLNFWIKNMCKESNHDMVPFHRLWHFPISYETYMLCSRYPCVFPNDHLTEQVPELVREILDGKECSRTKPEEVLFKQSPIRGVNQMKPQSIFVIED